MSGAEDLESRLVTFEQIWSARLEALDRLTEVRFAASVNALTKAEIATDKRFESVNEFRAQLSDQASRFATRETLGSLRDRVDSLTDANRKLIEEGHERARLAIEDVKSQTGRIAYALMSTVVGVLISALVGVLIIRR